MAKGSLLLIGQKDLIIDEKVRMLVPADMRKSIDPERDGTSLILVQGPNGKQWLYPELKYQALADAVKPDITPGTAEMDFAHLHYSLAERLELDSQGRLQFTKEWQAQSELSREVTLVGAGDHLEIWNRADWIERRRLVRERHLEIAMEAKKERRAPQSMPVTTEQSGSPAGA